MHKFAQGGPVDDSKRIWATVSAADAEALERVAAARGLRSSDLLREAVAALIEAPTQSRDASQLGLVMARLEGLAERLDRTVMSTRMAMDMAYTSEGERKDVREALTDIAMSIGVLAGSIEPAGSTDG